MSRVRDLTRAARRVPGVRRILEASDPSRRAARLVQSGIVDTHLYAAQLGVASIGVEEAAKHYVTEGFLLGYTVNVLLEPSLIRRWVMRSHRPAIYDYISLAHWRNEISPVWSVEEYLREFPEAEVHPAGPVGHLWERGTADPSLRVWVEPGGRRQVNWGTLYATLVEASAQWAALRRTQRERAPRPELEHPAFREDAVLPASGPTVSIVVPVRNRAGGLREAVESVQAQSWPWWELLIVDDGSWDETLAIGRLLASRDDRIRFIEKEHGGVCAARNVGIDAATGTYVAFLDSDNTWEEHFLRDMVMSMQEHGDETAYGTLDVIDTDGSSKFLYGSSNVVDLRLANSIDLNVLMTTLVALREIGGFDATLRRAVDYDLVLRLAARGPLRHIPVLGVKYDNSAEAADRISTSEPLGWNTAVRLKNEEPVPECDPIDGTTAICMLQAKDPDIVGKLSALVEWSAADRHVVVAAVSPRPDEWRATAISVVEAEQCTAVLYQRGEPFAYVADSAAKRVRTSHLMFLDARTHVDAALLEALAEESRAHDLPVMPITLAENGMVESAGSVFVGSQSTPARLFEGQPPEDPLILNGYEAPALSGRTVALATEAFRAVGGFDPLLFNEFSAEGLSLHLEQHSPGSGRARVLPMTAPQTGEPIEFTRVDSKGTRTALRALTRHVHLSDTTPYYAPLHQRVGGWKLSENDRLIPAIVREPGESTLPDGSVVPRLRWAIRTSAPAGPKGEVWGDTHFARSLAKALRALGQEAVVEPREADDRETAILDDVRVSLRGLDRVEPVPGQMTFLWVISHPDEVLRDEAILFDRVFAASLSWSEKMSERWQIPVSPLLQCTDPTIFHEQDEPRGEEIVFVGNSRGIPRPTVMETVRSGVPLTLYGSGWEGFIPEEAVTGEHYPNTEVSGLYGRAAVVLNDHWADMKREGFIANRLFDVVASGGRVLSDDIAGIEEIFGGTVTTFGKVAEISALLKGDIDELFAAEEERKQIADRIRSEHSFANRARALLDAAIEERSRIGL